MKITLKPCILNGVPMGPVEEVELEELQLRLGSPPRLTSVAKCLSEPGEQVNFLPNGVIEVSSQRLLEALKPRVPLWMRVELVSRSELGRAQS